MHRRLELRHQLDLRRLPLHAGPRRQLLLVRRAHPGHDGATRLLPPPGARRHRQPLPRRLVRQLLPPRCPRPHRRPAAGKQLVVLAAHAGRLSTFTFTFEMGIVAKGSHVFLPDSVCVDTCRWF